MWFFSALPSPMLGDLQMMLLPAGGARRQFPFPFPGAHGAPGLAQGRALCRRWQGPLPLQLAINIPRPQSEKTSLVSAAWTLAQLVLAPKENVRDGNDGVCVCECLNIGPKRVTSLFKTSAHPSPHKQNWQRCLRWCLVSASSLLFYDATVSCFVQTIFLCNEFVMSELFGKVLFL